MFAKSQWFARGTKTFAATTAAWCSLAAATALAQDQPRRPDPAALFDRLDVNQDGFVTENEMPQDNERLGRAIRRGDTNGDGKLTREEFVAAFAQRPERPQQRPGAGGPGGIDRAALFERLDRNRDGKISVDEMPEGERGARMLRSADRNGDKEVTKEEFMAVQQPPRGGEGRRPGMGPGGGPLLRALDANGDGTISAEEIAGAASALKQLDRNGDGQLTPEELGPPPRPMRPGEGRPGAARPDAGPAELTPAERFRQIDTNADGKISRDEAPVRLRAVFDRLDTNQDGFLEPSEMRRPDRDRPEQQ